MSLVEWNSLEQDMTDKSIKQNADRLAVQVGESMFSTDSASTSLGMNIEQMREGYARVSMRVRKDMLNGLGSCHGGIIFTLADSAFAFACNSRNQATVAAGCSIEFLRPVPPGALLIAEASERVLAGRRGVYDVLVRDQDGEIVATFCGKSGRVNGEVIGAPPLFS